ncbi:hypothetical protein GQ600_15809 [Phytophthora cactorum]|nr:hypothetical protein GQ600_15809 [Phytophthora cactorum]
MTLEMILFLREMTVDEATRS